jgi:alkylation response protein AidB-like acyl-CoA dehydrogenase
VDVEGATTLMSAPPGPDSTLPATRAGDEFRPSLTRWLGENLTPEVVAAGRAGLVNAHTIEILRAWNRTLADAGWAAISWPIEFGGRSATIAEQLAFHEVMVDFDAPGPVNSIGVANIAPAIMAIGTQEQKDRYLAPMLRGDEIWCQGMSEPDAGSDLASLKTSAVAVADGDGEGFVINGQKTWNSLGEFADWCQLYVRTDPSVPKHKGISCLLVDMRSPGVEVRPMRSMVGETVFSEIFFTDVRVPARALLGSLHEGWQVAMTTLSHERAGVARFHLVLTARFNELLEDARRAGVVATPVQRDRLARLYASIGAMRYMTTRELEAIGHGGQPSPAMGSVAKLMWAHATQELADLAVGLFGSGALDGPWTQHLIASPGVSIAGGTSDINRNIVAEHGLGLPR